MSQLSAFRQVQVIYVQPTSSPTTAPPTNSTIKSSFAEAATSATAAAAGGVVAAASIAAAGAGASAGVATGAGTAAAGGASASGGIAGGGGGAAGGGAGGGGGGGGGGSSGGVGGVMGDVLSLLKSMQFLVLFGQMSCISDLPEVGQLSESMGQALSRLLNLSACLYLNNVILHSLPDSLCIAGVRQFDRTSDSRLGNFAIITTLERWRR